MPMSPDEWRDRLLERYRTVQPSRQQWDALYDARQARPEPLHRYRQAYQRILEMSRTPWARLVVDLTEERLTVTGFQLDGDDRNELLWSLFRANHIESMQAQVHRESMSTGTSYVSVWPTDDGSVRMTYESSLAVAHENEPGDPHRVAGAVKVWHDPFVKRVRCNVYLPDEIYRWQSQGEVSVEQLAGFDWTTRRNWELRDASPVSHGYGMVPMVPFPTRPDWQGYGRSDLADVAETIRRIEYLTANTLLAVELGALRQRWATGLEVPIDPETNQPVEPFKVALDRLWISEDPDTKFGAFPETDIRPYLQAISDAVGQLSAVSRVPPTYFVQSDLSNPPSAASLEASETGLISKVKDRQHEYAEAWEKVAKLALVVLGGDASTELTTNMTVLWADPRTRSDAQVLDAASKMYAIEVPWAEILRFIGYTPDEVARLETERQADTFNRVLQSMRPNIPGVQVGGEPTPTNG